MVHGLTPGELASRLPGISAVMRAVLNILASHALIVNVANGALEYVAQYTSGDLERWMITDDGKRCLAELEALGHEDSA